MFWDSFIMLCDRNNKKPNTVARDLGLSNATATKWKKGAIPSGTTLQKIADYFGVPVSTLFSEKEEKPTAGGELSENTKKLIEFAQSLTEEQAKIAIKLLKAIIEE